MSALAPSSIANPTGDGKKLHVILGTGEQIVLHAETLRAACRCAKCRRAQIDGAFPENFEAVTVDHVSPMGLYGINIAFSDGHARGIFPWTYLAELAANMPSE
jgi:prepilin-type processing-associated H-X9-DG protein